MCFSILSIVCDDEQWHEGQRIFDPPILSACARRSERKTCISKEAISIERFKASIANVLNYGRTRESEIIDAALFVMLTRDSEQFQHHWVHIPDLGRVTFLHSDFALIPRSLKDIQLQALPVMENQGRPQRVRSNDGNSSGTIYPGLQTDMPPVAYPFPMQPAQDMYSFGPPERNYDEHPGLTRQRLLNQVSYMDNNQSSGHPHSPRAQSGPASQQFHRPNRRQFPPVSYSRPATDRAMINSRRHALPPADMNIPSEEDYEEMVYGQYHPSHPANINSTPAQDRTATMGHGNHAMSPFYVNELPTGDFPAGNNHGNHSGSAMANDQAFDQQFFHAMNSGNMNEVPAGDFPAGNSYGNRSFSTGANNQESDQYLPHTMATMEGNLASNHQMMAATDVTFPPYDNVDPFTGLNHATVSVEAVSAYNNRNNQSNQVMGSMINRDSRPLIGNDNLYGDEDADGETDPDFVPDITSTTVHPSVHPTAETGDSLDEDPIALYTHLYDDDYLATFTTPWDPESHSPADTNAALESRSHANTNVTLTATSAPGALESHSHADTNAALGSRSHANTNATLAPVTDFLSPRYTINDDPTINNGVIYNGSVTAYPAAPRETFYLGPFEYDEPPFPTGNENYAQPTTHASHTTAEPARVVATQTEQDNGQTTPPFPQPQGVFELSGEIEWDVYADLAYEIRDGGDRSHSLAQALAAAAEEQAPALDAPQASPPPFSFTHPAMENMSDIPLEDMFRMPGSSRETGIRSNAGVDSDGDNGEKDREEEPSVSSGPIRKRRRYDY